MIFWYSFLNIKGLVYSKVVIELKLSVEIILKKEESFLSSSKNKEPKHNENGFFVLVDILY